MAVLKILTAPDPKLKIKAEKVSDIQSVQTLIDDMLETLYTTSTVSYTHLTLPTSG